MYSPRTLPASEMTESQNFVTLEFHFTASAAGTKHVLVPKQSAAAPRVWCMTGNGSADMTAADAQALVKRPDGRTLDAVASALATGLVTYMTNVPAAADGAFCHAFAIGGVNPTDILMAELLIRPQGTSATNPMKALANFSSAVLIHSVRLNGSNAFLEDDGSTAVAAGTDTLVIVGGEGAVPQSNYENGQNSIVFGAVASPDVTDTVAAGDLLTLRLQLKC